ncbi:MAG TPA: RNA polymerase sigma factor [Phycisphaerales bacterium]|nr:RNA polymerase sigma factor [Phycisphaerales bacterium]
MTIQTPSVTLGAGELEAVGTLSPDPVITSPPAIDPTDESLLARFLRGERDALGLLAARHEYHLLGLASGLLNGRRDLAMDAVQETWLRVIKYGKSFRSGSTVKTWLYRILVNTAKDTRTKAMRMKLGGTGGLPPVENTPDTRPAHDHQQQTRIRAAIESLSGEHRLIVLLCYHHGLTHPQAAHVLDIPVGTLKSRLNAALTRLRENLKEPLA